MAPSPNYIIFILTIINLNCVYSSNNQCPLNQKELIEEFKSKYSAESLPVEIYKHYGHYAKGINSFHPSNLLLSSTQNEWYCSKQVKEMEGNRWCQFDWIIFKIKDEKNKYLPSKITILNHDAEAAVKYMSVYIGNPFDNTWYKLQENPFKFSMQKDYQQTREFNYEAINWDFNLIKTTNIQYIKVELLDNWMGDGHRFIDSCNFLFYHLSFYGYKL